MILQRAMPWWACGAWLWLAVTRGGFVTIAQGDAARSPRAPRTADVSANGRYVAFESWASLVPADDNQRLDVYVLDRITGRVTLESDALRGDCSHPRISADGRYVVFEARQLAPNGVESRVEIVLRDRVAETTKRLTAVGSDGTADGFSRDPDISDDGQVVVFSSAATDLTGGPDANGELEDVYAIQLSTGAVTRVSVSTSGTHVAKGASGLPSVSGDGRWVAFSSTAPLDAPASRAAHESPTRQIYVRDLLSGTTMRVSRTARGQVPEGGDSMNPAISADGRFIAFSSDATNIVDNDGNRATDVFLFDREKQETTLVSRTTGGSVAAGVSANPTISADGRFVAFQSDAANLVCASRCAEAEADINLLWDTFIFDRVTTKIARVSEDELGGWMDWSAGIAIDGTGSVVAFSSRHPRDASDRLDDVDLFIRTIRPQ